MGIASNPPSPRPSILDAEHLDQLRELPGSGAGTLLDELIEIMERDVPPDLARLRAMVQQRAATEVAQLAHRVAGSAGSLGAISLRLVLHQIEQAGRKADWPVTDRIVATLDQEWAGTREALRKISSSPPPSKS